MLSVEGGVTADYSQVELHVGEGGAVGVEDAVGLVLVLDRQSLGTDVAAYAILTVARQHGDVPVRVEVHDGPPPADPRWDAVTELSVRSGDAVTVTGWAGDGSLTVPVPAGADLRVRYAVVDGQAGSDQFADGRWDEPPAETYVLQLWPAPPAPARLVSASTPWAQYWAFGPDAAAAVQRLADVPDPERLVALVDEALAAHPDTAARVRAGDESYRVGVIRYAQELFRVTHASGVYADLQRDHQALARLIDARAALAA
ncbi:hypothetical protein AB6N23_04725 [Cellulomonas sp. 179-A 9B4 NHS]|uniref:hypothetical protein n=1 Tax=Cellulomonas sp. 179-A 9B4 NHS TaxID=3142379 RepID=UPI00399F791E